MELPSSPSDAASWQALPPQDLPLLRPSPPSGVLAPAATLTWLATPQEAPPLLHGERRPDPQRDPDLRRLSTRRNDADSINRTLDDTLLLRRAHSVGHERKHLNLLTHALVVNGLAIWLHQALHSDPPLPLAA